MPASLSAELLAVISDKEELISRLHIVDEKGIDSTFSNPHPEQVDALRDFCSPVITTCIYLKSRQIGLSTIKSADEFATLYMARDPIRTLLCADHRDTTDTLHAKLKYYYQCLPSALKRPIHASNSRELTFADTGAGIRCLTAGSPQMGKGGTYQRIVAEEMAFWVNADDVWGSLQATQHEGPHLKKFIISTSAGPNNLYHRMVLSAQKAMLAGDPRTMFRFFRWFDHRTYAMSPPKTWEPTQEEVDVATQYGLTLAQLYWRHNKIWGADGIGEQRFSLHYPASAEEAFAHHEGSWFDSELLASYEASLAPKKGELRIYEQPRAGVLYAAGVDPAWCNGGNQAALQIVDMFGHQVCTYATNQGGEENFGDNVSQLLFRYNKAKVLVEDNAGGGGRVVRKKLMADGHKMWTKPKESVRGKSRFWVTSNSSNAEGYSWLKKQVNGDALTLNDYQTVQQLQHIREDDGVIEGTDGYEDDLADALMLAEWNRKTLPGESAPINLHRRKRRAQSKNPWLETALHG